MKAKLTRKQGRRLIINAAQALGGFGPGSDDAALQAAFGLPNRLAQTGDALLVAKLLGRGFSHPVHRMIAHRAWYAGGAADCWTRPDRRGKLPSVYEAWAALEFLAPQYGLHVQRATAPGQPITCRQSQPGDPGHGQAGSGAGDPADPTTADPTTAAPIDANAKGGSAPIGQGTYRLATAEDVRALSDSLRATGKPRQYVPAFPALPGLALALQSHTRRHVRRCEDGEDGLHQDAAPALALGLCEPVLARNMRARSEAPAVLVLIDQSGSMQCHKRENNAAAAANAIAAACRSAGVPVMLAGFGNDVQAVAHFSGPSATLYARPKSHGGTDLPRALRTTLPLLAARREPRKLVLIVTDGAIGADESKTELGGPIEGAVRAARHDGIELYCIGLQVDIPPGFDGSVRLDRVADLPRVAGLELARVIGKGQASAA